LAVGLGATMASSGAFTLAFQASGIGYIGQSVLALLAGSTLIAGGFALAGRTRLARLQSTIRPHLMTNRPFVRPVSPGLPRPSMRALPPTR
jgi:hypothetical protein